MSKPNELNDDIARYGEGLRELDALGHRLLLRAFQDMRVLHAPGERYGREELRQRLGIVDGYARLHEALLEMLERAGFLRTEGAQVVTTGRVAPVELADLERLRDELSTRHPSFAPHARLLWACLRAYPGVLRGREDALGILFPEGSLSLVEGVYRGNAAADYFNRVMARLITTYLGRRLQLDPEAKLRLLEVGAGTGSTSSVVLPALTPFASALTYVYTDVSARFLKHGERAYAGAHPFAVFRRLDIEQSPAAQGFEADSVDLVVATNVLHATRDMARTMRHVKWLLKANGLLVLNEVMERQDFSTLTFGLTKGWWLYDDTHVRIPGSPLLSAGSWRAVLQGGGWRGVRLVDSPPGGPAPQVLIAESDGVVSMAAATSEVSRVRAPTVAPSAPAAPVAPAPDARGLVRSILARVLKVDASTIDDDQTFEAYGLDSLIVLEVMKPLGEAFGGLPATLLFEHTSVGKLAAYFQAHHLPALTRLLSGGNAASPAPLAPPVSLASAPAPLSDDELWRGAVDHVRGVIASVLKLDARDIDAEGTFEAYGVDSLIALTLMKPFTERFGGLPATLLFEHMTPGRLARYFVEHHRDALVRLLQSGPPRPATASVDSLFAAPEPVAPLVSPPPAVPASVAVPAAAVPVQAPGAVEEGIAVIGMSGRFPASENLERFWENLAGGRSCISEIPADRWDWRAHFDPGAKTPGKSYSKWGGFISGVDAFDPLFFGITPREAEVMDPQERLFLEAAWGALEDAGYPRRGFDAEKRRVGVFVGVMNGSYGWIGAEEAARGNHSTADSNYWSIANRVSYIFDLQGPSLAIDTACSSSLTAIHLACESLRRGECSTAIAGGVNLILHPRQYARLCDMHMLSEDGRCKAFGEGADGFVDGEGVGALLLKPLSRALADGDHIHGVIRASSVNAGGKTSGYTVPNPNAQAELVARVLETSGVDPSTITYMEAHGTGTSLGDPIEIRGLTKAFQQWTGERQFCAIGSVKSNIGHLESAAGVAGVIKVLLQLEHRSLVPSLHSERLNGHISFEETPFRVQRTREPWEPLVRDGRPVPRRASISSFGAGGANAHMLIEEAPEALARGGEERPGYLVTLSAATEESLQRRVVELEEWLGQRGRALRLADISFTLNAGREHFAERRACVVGSVEELRGALGRLRAGGTPAGWWAGTVVRRKGAAAPAGPVAPEESLRHAAGVGVEEYRSRLAVVAQAYVAGHEPDWSPLYGERGARRVSLPTYPFLGERYWIPGAGERPGSVPAVALLHPLLERNESTLDEQAFAKSFAPTDTFVAHHVVRGEKLLPGVVSLEMARAAGDLSRKGMRVVEVADVVWRKPVAINGSAIGTRIVLAEEGGQVRFSVRLEGAGEIHAQGRLVYGEPVAPSRVVSLVDLERRLPGVHAREELYSRFAAAGFQYGPAFQSLEWVRCSERELVAALRLPAAARDGALVLHPSLMDGALQAVMWLELQGAGGRGLSLPFGLGRVQVFRALPERCFAHVETRTSSQAGRTYDLALFDETGALLALIEGFSVRPVREQGLPAPAPEREEQGAPGYHEPRWEERPAPGAASTGPVLLLDDDDTRAQVLRSRWGGAGVGLPVVIQVRTGTGFRQLAGDRYEVEPSSGADWERLLAALEARGWALQDILHLWAWEGTGSSSGNEEGALSRGVGALFELTQTLMRRKARSVRLLVAYREDAEGAPFAAMLAGFARSLARENPEYRCGTVALGQGGPSPADLAEVLRRELSAGQPWEPEVRHAEGRRWVRRLRPVELAPAVPVAPGRMGGTYLVTGGLRGLGFLFARHLARSRRARLVLVGRSALDASGREHLTQLERLGAEVLYLQGDVARMDSVRSVLHEARARFGALHGILHCAGVVEDAFLLKKTRGQLERVLAPKVLGVLNLERASREEPLEFFVLFSSIASVLGNVGQVDYAAANAFLDAFAHQREQARLAGHRQGRTVSINWPAWREGGMRADEATAHGPREAWGMEPLTADTGLPAFERVLASSGAQVAVIHADPARFQAALEGAFVTPAPAALPPPAEPARSGSLSEEALRAKAELMLRQLVAARTKLPVEKLRADQVFQQLGIDSLIILELTEELERGFGPLPKTLFFEYESITELVDYFLKSHGPALRRMFAPPPEAVVAPPEPPQVPVHVVSTEALAPVTPEVAADGIAIIGMSGRYPLASNLEEYWRNLESGRDCITEIPAERWEHSRYFHPDKEHPGSTYGKWGGFIPDHDRFDPLFFGISPRDAELMDPQERLFLQAAWETLEDAGYTREDLETQAQGRGGGTGVFVGVMYGHYQLYGAEESLKGHMLAIDSSYASVANRVSYTFNFHGPSLAVDTMCSSSLTALHLACESLRRGECRVALAGGVNVMSHPNKYLLLAQGRFLSTDGRCRSFGEGGDGYVPGEGVGAVLLKPLADALRDGDRIHGVIRGSAINHGGRANNYTVPNPNAQARVIAEALRRAGVSPATISYVEAHGTGTSLGDPIELRGLGKVFADASVGRQSCAIGSVKSNIGHLESAAGIAAVTKVLLQLRHGKLVPSLHAERLNPHIDFEGSPFRVQRELGEWRPVPGMPRRAGISSFGAGGSNVHIVIDEAPASPSRRSAEQRPAYLLTLSARTDDTLQRRVADLARWLEGDGREASLADIGYTLTVGREHFARRCALVVSSREELRAALEALREGGTPDACFLSSRVSPEGLPQPEAVSGLLEAVRHASGAVPRATLHELARLYAGGLSLDFPALHAGTEGRRISLPTHPFKRERYWVPDVVEGPGGGGAGEKREPEADEAVSLGYYRPAWERTAVRDLERGEVGPVLVLGAGALVEHLAGRLRPGQLVRVTPGGGFEARADGTYTVRPGEREDWTALLTTLRQRQLFPRGVLHLGATRAWEATREALEAQLAQGLYPLLALGQALVEQKPRERLPLVVAWRREREAVEPAYAAASGFAKSLTLEFPLVDCRVMELVATSPDEAADVLLRELRAGAGTGVECRYENGERWAKALRPVPARDGRPPGGLPLRQRGTYVITGGAGRLGLLFAEYLARRVSARLVLTGRSALDGRKEAQLQRLRELGAEVLYLRCDVASRSELEQALREARARFGPLHGVIHGAGVMKDSLLLTKEPAGFASILAPKVLGTVNLDEATRPDPLDFFVLWSSIASVMQTVGQTDYASANTFLDHFAVLRERERAAGLRSGQTLSINWPLWQDEEMRIDGASQDSFGLWLRQVHGIALLSTERGLRAFEELLLGEAGQVCVIDGEHGKVRAMLRKSWRLEGGEARPAPREDAPPETEAAPRAAPAPTAAAGGSTQVLRERLVEGLLASVSRLLKIDRGLLEPGTSFNELGFDSVSLKQLSDRLNQDYGITTMPSIFYAYTDARSLAAHLVSEFGPRLGEVLGTARAALAPAPAVAAPSAPAPAAEAAPARGQLRRSSSLGAHVASAPHPDTGRLALDEPIAIVGIDGLFPESEDLETFWKHLEAAHDLIREIPAERWDWRRYYDGGVREPHKTNSKWGGFVPDVDKFDPAFFKMSQREAELMDPQHRLFLQCAWRAIEDAGHRPSSLSGREVGVFVGVQFSEYQGLLGNEFHTYLSTGNSHTMLANRVSYLLNLHGPSEAVNTACSSSLVALHRAVLALRTGECEAALAGGVSLALSPRTYVATTQMGILSPDGRCKTYDRSANGYVKGEGVGALFLKPLSRALADGDPIHALIRGTAVNHGGKAQSLTAPNSSAQRKLLVRAYSRAGVDPRTVTYIENHGTGTELGDPVEIEGLKEAFKELTGREGGWEQPGWCGLGSVKSNIGHLEPAAGVAGVLKVVLALRNRVLPATLHCHELNPYIQLDASPFYLVRETRPWEALRDEHGQEIPRRAGISSFGFGGAYAHAVLEEAPSRPALPVAGKPWHLVTLSAKADESLTRLAARLEAALAGAGAELTLEDVSYTLNVGRDHFGRRCAFVVASLEELRRKLRQVAEGQVPERVLRGQGDVSQYRPEPLHTRLLKVLVKEMEEPGALSAEDYRDNLLAMADLYVRGYGPDWTPLHRGERHQRVALPAYAFLKKRCWAPAAAAVQEDAAAPSAGQARASAELALVERVLERARPLLEDHRVGGQPVFPGVGYFSLAFEAVAQATSRQPRALEQVVWLQPVVVESAERRLRVVVTALPDGGFRYEVRSHEGAEWVTHGSGVVRTDEGAAPAERPVLPLRDISARCTRRLLKAEVYRRFAEGGLDYGPYFQVVEEVSGGADEALGRLSLAPRFREEVPEAALHAGLLDGALQCILALTESSSRAMLPFSVGAVAVLGALEPEMFAHVRRAGPQRFDVTLADARGEVRVRLRDVALRAGREPVDDLLLAPRWVPTPRPASQGASVVPAPGSTPRTVLVVHNGQQPALVSALRTLHAGEDVLELTSPDAVAIDSRVVQAVRLDCVYFLGGLRAADFEPSDLAALDASQEQGGLALLRLVKSLVRYRYGAAGLTLKVVVNGVHALEAGARVMPLGAPLVGMVQSLAKEYPSWAVGCVDICLAELEAELAARGPSALEPLVAEPAHPHGEPVVLRGGVRYARVFEKLALPAPGQVPLREEGVYLILGGAGGIGLVLGEYLAREVRARLVLVGRSPLSAEQRARVAAIEAAGGQVLYLQADATDPVSLRAAVERARARFGAIHGAVHSAIVLKDRTLANMDEETFLAALAPKVRGSVVLHQALAGEPLDFLAFFSSAQGLLGDAGQSNYAAGCAFKDAFAHHLASTQPYPVKVFDWGYWGRVGIVATEEYNRRLSARGVLSIEPAEGMEAIRRVLGSRVTQVMPLKVQPWVLAQLGVEVARPVRVYPAATPACLDVLPRSEKELSLDGSGLRAYSAAFGELETFGHQLLLRALQRMGVFRRPGERYTREALAKALGVVPDYVRLLEAFGELLVEARFLARDGDSLVALEAVARLPEAEARRLALTSAHPEIAAHVNLLWICTEAYPEVLTGRRDHMQVMFPDGSLTLVEGIYRGNPAADYYNRIVALLARGYVEQRLRLEPRACIRILEIGAGTGGTSALVLESLAPYGQHLEYHYTDISAGFTRHGEREFQPRFPFVRCRPLNIQNPPARQGFEPGGFDLAIATNVLHATADIRRTLEHTKELLAAHGLVLLNEVMVRQAFTTMTFGLTRGWWMFDDPDLRIPGSPLLSAARWRSLLATGGWDVRVLEGLSPSPAAHVVVAASDGIVKTSAVEPRDEAAARPAAKDPVAAVPAPVAAPAPTAVSAPAAALPEAELERRAADYLKGVLSAVLKIEPASIEVDQTLEVYGVDSLIILELMKPLTQVFGYLPATFLFEYMTVRKAVGYLVHNHREVLERMGAPAAEPAPVAPLPAPVAPLPAPVAGSGSAAPPAHEEAIAIIGVSGRFPGAETLEHFWENLKEGRNCIREIPRERWDWREYHSTAADVPGKSYSRWGGFIEDVDKFDPLFFQLSPLEAEVMDPQERLFLQAAWSTLEDAGYTRKRIAAEQNRIGVFVGVMNGSYGWIGAEEWAKGHPNNADSGHWSIANRVSYQLDLLGPSLAVDTACSSSLTAIHLACESLRRAECTAAVAGGVNLILHPRQYARLSSMRMLSQDDKCRAFGDGANGFVDGEGVGAIFLKPLSRALAEGDRIHGVIRATAINAGGKTSGYTVPNPNAQAEVIQAALRRAAIDPRTITYVEAHGTGTSLGDPIEIRGLSKAFGEHTPEKQFCAVGSVKGNIGHLESAAGVAGITKVLLQLRHGKLVPSINSERLNTHIRFEDSPFFVQRELEDWRPPVVDGRVGPRRAGISSFGAGGANAHLVIEEAPARPAPAEGVEPEYRLVAVSARTEEGLHQRLVELAGWLEAHGQQASLASVAYTLNVRREHFSERVVFLVRSLEELRAAVRRAARGELPADCISGSAVRERARREPAFAEARRELDAGAVRGLSGEPLRAALETLGESFALGRELDWALVHAGETPRLLSLPTYPFARERCWVAQPDEGGRRPAAAWASGHVPAPHPLLDLNVSTLQEQRFQKTFSGEEFYLRDHVLDGERVLPGVVSLEMARAAGALSLEEGRVAVLRDVVWAQPLRVREGGATVLTALRPVEQGLGYEVYSTASGERIVHARGLLRLTDTGAAPPPVDVRALASRMRLVGEDSALYARFLQAGVRYGPGFQALRWLRRDGDLALGELQLSADLAGEAGTFGLHPSLLDGALQALLDFGGGDGNGHSGGVLVPFAADAVRLFGSLPARCFVLVSRAPGAASRTGALQRYDVRLLDGEGRTLVSIEGLAVRALKPRQEAAPRAPVAAVPIIRQGAGDDFLRDLISQLKTGRLTLDEATSLLSR